MESEKVFEKMKIAMQITIILAVFAFLFFYGRLIIDTINQNFGETVTVQKFLPGLLDATLIIGATEIFLIITRYVISKYLENRGQKKETKIILSLYTYLIWGIIAIFLVSTMFKDIGALITSVGLIGFGITFALQKPILNFVGWLAIVLNKPFNIGDRIEVSETRGDVVSVHPMYTRVQGTRLNAHEKNDTIISIPNELILTNPIVNYSRTGERFTDEIIISITYESNWKKAIEILQKVAENVVKKHVKQQVPKSFAEKRAWQEAIRLMQEASKKLRKGNVKDSVKEKIEILKTAETAAEIEIPKPDIQMILADSSINLAVLYQTDLRSIRSSKNEIVKTFMEEIEKREDIELAYPHMQIVYNENGPKKFSVKQKKLFKNESAENPEQKLQ